MPIISDLLPEFDVDAVLRGQGADPAIIRGRRPAMVKMAEQALAEGIGLLEPRVVYREIAVTGVRHERLLLAGDLSLESKLLAKHLAQAQVIYAMVCSIGNSLEQYASEMWAESAGLSLALDGVGSAAVEALANAACHHLETQAAAKGWQTSIPLSPGMLDWPLDAGQPQIFGLLSDEPLTVELTPSYIMLPRKSLSMIVGAGPEMTATGRTCDYCNLREVCRYQDHYDK